MLVAVQNKAKIQNYFITILLMEVTPQLLKILFPSMEANLRDALVKEGQVKELKEGDVLVSSGQYIKSAFLVLDGVVKVSREDDEGKEFLMYYLEPGSACALSLLCAARNEKSAITARAITDATAISIPFQATEAWLKKYRSWHEFVVGTYRRRFEELLLTLDGVAFKSMDERLVFYLKRKEKVSGKILTISHQEIANDLSTAREVVSRLLKKLEQIGVVKLTRNHIEIVDLQKFLV